MAGVRILKREQKPRGSEEQKHTHCPKATETWEGQAGVSPKSSAEQPPAADCLQRPLLRRIVGAMLLRRCTKNARILLVILFPCDTAAVTALDSSDFWAFNDGMSEA